jgi:hypothetical protein
VNVLVVTILITMLKSPGAPVAALAAAADWLLSSGKPHKSRVARLLKTLAKDRPVKTERGVWSLTEKGAKEANRLIEIEEMAGAKYG